MPSEEYKQKMHDRIDYRKDEFLVRVARLRRKINEGILGGEEDRIWLDQYAKGKGLDICCGDFLVRDAEGVDPSIDKIGPTYFHIMGDELIYHDGGELDFITCNYFDAFPNVLKTLNEWMRVLKPGGTLAIIVRDSEKYTDRAGPMANKNRVSCYTPFTIKCYLERAGFDVMSVEEGEEKSLRVLSKKP